MLNFPFRRSCLHPRCSTIALVALALVILASPVRARFVLTLQETGNSVTIMGTGSLDTTGLTPPRSGPTPRLITPNRAILYSGSYFDRGAFSGITGPSNFGLGGTSSATNVTGTAVGVAGADGLLVWPNGLPANFVLTSTSTYANQTFASLGFTPGTYTYLLPSGDTFVVAAVPEPSTWVALAASVGLLGAGWLRRRPPQG